MAKLYYYIKTLTLVSHTIFDRYAKLFIIYVIYANIPCHINCHII